MDVVHKRFSDDDDGWLAYLTTNRQRSYLFHAENIGPYIVFSPIHRPASLPDRITHHIWYSGNVFDHAPQGCLSS